MVNIPPSKIIKTSIRLLSTIIPSKKLRKQFRSYTKNKLELQPLKKIYRYLGKYYNNVSVKDDIDYQEVGIDQLPIWQLWIQGEAAAPEIVKKCLASVRKYAGEREVILLTEQNWQNYIELPKFIMEKFDQKIITYTHFSDILRVCLLEKYGGTWIDATVFLTDSIASEIENASFFAFEVPKDSYYADVHLTSSWFIHAKPEHLIIKGLKRALFNYWQHENELMDYFLIHLLLKGVVDKNTRLKKLWKNSPHISNQASHALQFSLLEEFDYGRWQIMKEKISIHKLTYKLETVNDKKDTFLYNFITKDSL